MWKRVDGGKGGWWAGRNEKIEKGGVCGVVVGGGGGVVWEGVLDENGRGEILRKVTC